MKTSIVIAAVMITIRLMAELMPGTHHMTGSDQLPAKYPTAGYYGEWHSYIWDRCFKYEENGRRTEVWTEIPVASTWQSSWNIDLTPHPNKQIAYGNANITWNENGYVKSQSAYGKARIDVEIYEVP